MTFLSKISVAFLRVLRVMGDENDLTNACKFIEGIFRRVLSVANMVYHYHTACLPNKMFLESCCRSVVFATLRNKPRSTVSTHYFCVDDELVYEK